MVLSLPFRPMDRCQYEESIESINAKLDYELAYTKVMNRTGEDFKAHWQAISQQYELQKQDRDRHWKLQKERIQKFCKQSDELKQLDMILVHIRRLFGCDFQGINDEILMDIHQLFVEDRDTIDGYVEMVNMVGFNLKNKLEKNDALQVFDKMPARNLCYGSKVKPTFGETVDFNSSGSDYMPYSEVFPQIYILQFASDYNLFHASIHVCFEVIFPWTLGFINWRTGIGTYIEFQLWGYWCYSIESRVLRYISNGSIAEILDNKLDIECNMIQGCECVWDFNHDPNGWRLRLKQLIEKLSSNNCGELMFQGIILVIRCCSFTFGCNYNSWEGNVEDTMRQMYVVLMNLILVKRVQSFGSQGSQPGLSIVLKPNYETFFLAMTNIVGTLGSRSRSVEVIFGCLKAGMFVARFEYLRGSPEYHHETLETLKAVVKSTKKLCVVMLNTVGAELQVANKSEKHIFLKENGVVVLAPDQRQEVSSELLPINFDGLAKSVKHGQRSKFENYGGKRIITDLVSFKDVIWVGLERQMNGLNTECMELGNKSSREIRRAKCITHYIMPTGCPSSIFNVQKLSPRLHWDLGKYWPHVYHLFSGKRMSYGRWNMIWFWLKYHNLEDKVVFHEDGKRMKFVVGLFEFPLADRSLLDIMGCKLHREPTREITRKSLVLLENGNNLEKSYIPLDIKVKRILVCGLHADDLGYHCEGWTGTWHGGSGKFTIGTTILDATIMCVDRSIYSEWNEVKRERFVVRELNGKRSFVLLINWEVIHLELMLYLWPPMQMIFLLMIFCIKIPDSSF